jgi:hypothetical protein
VRWVVASVAVLLGLLAGCGDQTDRVLEAGGAYVVVGSDPDQGDDAAISGVVELVGDCLGIAGRVVYWATGTEVVSTDPLVLDVPGDGRVEVGDSLSGAGGTLGGTPDRVEVPEGCPGELVSYRSD